MAGRNRYVITIDANGAPAVTELGKVETAAEGVDGAITDIDSNDSLGGIATATDGIKTKMADLAGPAAIGAVGVALLDAVNTTIELATEVQQLEELLDIDAEAASRLRAVFADAGLEIEDILAIASDTAIAISENEEFAARFGIAAGTVLDPMDAIKLAIDGWDLLTPTERVTLFGEEGSFQLSTLLASGKDFDELMAGIADIRLISDEQQAEVAELAAASAEIKGLWEGIQLTIANDLIPKINLLKDAVDAIPTDNPVFEALADAAKAAIDPIGGVQREWERANSTFEIGADLTAEISDNVDGIDKDPEVEVDIGYWGLTPADVTREVNAIPDKTVTVTVRRVEATGPPIGATGIGAGSSTINNIAVNMPRAAGMRDVESALARWSHLNGGRTP